MSHKPESWTAEDIERQRIRFCAVWQVIEEAELVDEYDDLKYKEEAHIFADQQKHVKALSSFETFKAHIEADDPKQKMIEAIVQSSGLAITSTKPKNGSRADSTLERNNDK